MTRDLAISESVKGYREAKSVGASAKSWRVRPRDHASCWVQWSKLFLPLCHSLLYRVQAQCSNYPPLCIGERVEKREYNGGGVGGNFFLSEGRDLELSPLIGLRLLEERRL